MFGEEDAGGEPVCFGEVGEFDADFVRVLRRQEKKRGNSLKAGVRMQRDWRKPKVWYSSCRTHLP